MVADPDFDPTERPDLLTVAEVADLLRVSKMTIYRLLQAGKLPGLRIGQSFRIPAEAVRKMLETR